MKAPDKLYYAPYGDISENHPITDNDIEYVRTDAFIEKALEFFGENLWDYIDLKNVNCNTFINIDGDKLKDDFINYMIG